MLLPAGSRSGRGCVAGKHECTRCLHLNAAIELLLILAECDAHKCHTIQLRGGSNIDTSVAQRKSSPFARVKHVFNTCSTCRLRMRVTAVLCMLHCCCCCSLWLPLRKSVCIARNHSGAARPVTLYFVSLSTLLKHILLRLAFSIVPLHTHTHTTYSETERQRERARNILFAAQLAVIFALFDSISITTNDISALSHVPECVCVPL